MDPEAGQAAVFSGCCSICDLEAGKLTGFRVWGLGSYKGRRGNIHVYRVSGVGLAGKKGINHIGIV